MGTYTTNYQLYMPSIGEQGWGTLVNGNFTTIDTTMKSLSNRITAVETEVNGNLNCTSVITSGKITGNGGIVGTTGTFSGAVTGNTFNGVVLKSSGTITVTPTSSIVINNLVYAYMTNASQSSATILPFSTNTTYSGSIKVHNNTSSSRSLTYVWDFTSASSTAPSISVPANADATLSFTNIRFLRIGCLYNVSLYGFTLT